MREEHESASHSSGALYTIAAWAGLVFTAAVLIWLLWTLLENTASGTTRSGELQAARPVQTELATYFQEQKTGADVAALVELPSMCAACHTIEGTKAVGKIGPDLSDIGSVAEERIASPEYQASSGNATKAAEYIRESILDPSAFCVSERDNYCTPSGSSTMSPTFGAALDPRDLEQLIEYLTTLR
jgi:cytochrome c2